MQQHHLSHCSGSEFRRCSSVCVHTLDCVEPQNDKVWNDSFVLECATSMLFEWNAARKVQVSSTVDGNVGLQNQYSGLVKWHKPSIGRMKCNNDASFPNHGNRFGIGMCIWDEVGAFVLAKTEWYQPKYDVHIGEALGLEETTTNKHVWCNLFIILSLNPRSYIEDLIINSDTILFQGRIACVVRLRPSLPKQK
jgi:hypothetical protein